MKGAKNKLQQTVPRKQDTQNSQGDQGGNAYVLLEKCHRAKNKRGVMRQPGLKLKFGQKLLKNPVLKNPKQWEPVILR